MSKKKRENPRKVKDEQIRAAVKAKYQRMKDEVSRNPNNTVTAMRLAGFKKLHVNKLDLDTRRKKTNLEEDDKENGKNGKIVNNLYDRQVQKLY